MSIRITSPLYNLISLAYNAATMTLNFTVQGKTTSIDMCEVVESIFTDAFGQQI